MVLRQVNWRVRGARRPGPFLLVVTLVFPATCLLATPGPLRAADYVRDILPILKAQCLDCHDAETREGGLDLQRFRTPDDALADRAAWKTIFDAVEAGQMPLRDSGYELNEPERRKLLEFVERLQSCPDPVLGAIDPGKPVLRRLTRLEYNNTVRDLFGLDFDIFVFPERLPVADKRYFLEADKTLGQTLVTSMREYGQKYDVLLPRLGLPGDNRAEHGFANRGDSLNMSPLLLEKYLDMASAVAHSERLHRESPVMARLLGVAAPAAPEPEPPAGRERLVPAVASFAANGNLGLQAERFAEFLGRAFRRPVTDVERESYLAIIDQAKAAGRSESEAIRLAVQAVLASPEFLFIAEPLDPEADAVRPLNDFELATRLSYFLWSSMPDEPLWNLAQQGRLRDPETLRGQIGRMLAVRRRSRELCESFAVQWLRLDQLHSAKPDGKLFPRFYSGPQGKSTLHAPMMTEALLLFETVLVEDRSVIDLIDADFNWLNGQLANLYGLEAVYEKARERAMARGEVPAEGDGKGSGKYWFRCSLPDRSRGGVMTMAGPLTLTSLPYRTSPIKRGAWLLETLFNRPPAEPKVAFVLEDKPGEDASGSESLSIRQRFEKHRTDPNCYSCHSRIDPPGFSLETFDAIGAVRTHDGAQPVDASGTWNGRPFRGAAEFKSALRVREREFVRGFVEHLLSYALGRELEHYDVPAVSAIVRQSKENGYRMSGIMEAVVTSYPFLNVRNTKVDP